MTEVPLPGTDVPVVEPDKPEPVKATTLYVRNEAGQFAAPYSGLPMFPEQADLDFLVGYLQDRGYVVLTAAQALERQGRAHRTPDWPTSVAGAAHVAPRAGSQKARLLAVYADQAFKTQGITDEEAADRADLLRSCYWKRAGELRDGGWIVETGWHREGSAGAQRICCRITDSGMALYRALQGGE